MTEFQQSLDSILRPTKWGDYIGQENIKNNLKVLIQAAKERKQMPEHILLYGGPGFGKTTLSHLIGNELGVPIQVTTGAVIDKSGDIVSILSTMEKGGVLFIDEIHRLNRNIEEILYPIMESGGIDLMIGKGPSARSVRIDMPPTTIVAATTQIGKLSSPLRARFSGGIFKLNQYTEDELKKIIKHSAEVLKIGIDEKSIDAIAKRSRYTPRTANYLLKRVRDYAQINGTEINLDMVIKTLNEREIDEYGLTGEDRNILKTIYEIFGGGPVGLKALASTTGEDERTIEEVYEPFLIHIGFLERGMRGRKLTEKGSLYVEQILN